ncbi:hypothetical protein ACHAWF_016857, partial [Thalassiosira exigua]
SEQAGVGEKPSRQSLSSSSSSTSSSTSRPRRFSLRSLLKMAGDQPSDGAREGIRYLGSGENAIIRPGVVLVAPNHEYDHFLMRSAVFVYAIGLDENESTIIRAFTIGEMSPNVMGGLAQNQLFRGGYDGSDTAMLLHSAGGSGASVKSDTMIGSSGIFEGGIVSAMESADAGVIEPSDCKFFFNYMQFTEKELSNMFAGSEDGDEWVSLEIPTDYVLDSDYERGELWSKLRNNIRGIRGRP